MGRSLRQLATKCGDCGVVFDENNPKQPKRALCIPCYRIEFSKTIREKARLIKENKISPNRQELYVNYREDNREGFWREINKEIRLTKNREEHLVFIAKQMDRILSDERLMDYINHTTIVENNKTKQYDRSKK